MCHYNLLLTTSNVSQLEIKLNENSVSFIGIKNVFKPFLISWFCAADSVTFVKAWVEIWKIPVVDMEVRYQLFQVWYIHVYKKVS